MAEELKVYLDHLIPRESLRYKRPKKDTYRDQSKVRELRMVDLVGNHPSSRIARLCKPDFQRATTAWSPDDVVLLLDSVINEQVIPSIIMWYSKDNGREYILDGGHRVSAVIAWLNNDWGDTLPPELYGDEEQENLARQAAIKIRQQVQAQIGNIEEYEKASQQFDQVVNEGGAPLKELDSLTFKRAQFYNNFRRGEIHFDVLWVQGDYRTAELSFLKINRSGRQITDWERKLVESRDSSFARTVMALANINSADHYWPLDLPDDSLELQEKIKKIGIRLNDLHSILFIPTYQTPIRSYTLPLLAIPQRYKRPYQIAELLTITEGGKGQEPETQKLLSADSKMPAKKLINNGERLVNNAHEIIGNLLGPTQKSLTLVPALYFYTESGRYVRSLLYGFIYWLLSGPDEDVLQRKRLYSAHRSTFEQVLLARKNDVAGGITRKTASGPGVTAQTAQYYQELLKLLIKYDDDIETEAFINEYGELVAKLTNRKIRKPQAREKAGRFFTPKMKSTARLNALIESMPVCGICGGKYDPTNNFLEHDHIQEWSKGGQTTVDNQRLVHPFCNNQHNREKIEALKSGQQTLNLPFFDADNEMKIKQLSFLEDERFL